MGDENGYYMSVPDDWDGKQHGLAPVATKSSFLLVVVPKNCVKD
jgi:hypothetical protein